MVIYVLVSRIHTIVRLQRILLHKFNGVVMPWYHIAGLALTIAGP